MDLTYDEYLNFINHLFIQEYLDDEYHTGRESTVGALTIL
jgi:hypothetical protein